MDSIIFDVDGTLWDSADSVAAAWNLAIKKFSSLDITLDREILGSVFGKTMTDIGDILFPSLSETEKDSLLSNVEIKMMLRDSCDDMGLPRNQQGWGKFNCKKFLAL